ncbi:MAG: hypothetical protein K6L76_14235 [Agarilytica sp.]
MENLALESPEEEVDHQEALHNDVHVLPTDTEIKPLLRILRSLAEDIKRSDASFQSPNAWVLRDLIRHHFCNAGKTHWLETLCWTLTNIAMRTNPRSPHQEALILATSIPCEISEIHNYAIAILDHLATQTCHH